MNNTTDELNERFGIDGVARFESGEGGLTKLSISTATSDASLYTHGAHVTRFQIRGQKPLLWMSGASQFADGKAIRGGVPLVFPWFGPHQEKPDAPSHGLVRTAQWTVAGVDQTENGDVRVALTLSVGSYELEYRVSVGRELTLEMTVTNKSSETQSFEQAFHTYLSVGDIKQIGVHGLEGATYIDKLDGPTRKTQPDSPIVFAGETDSVYIDTESTVLVKDPQLERTIAIRKQGSRSTVVWNPWIAKAKRMPDFGDDEWPGMLCIETANIADNRIELEPGNSATMTASIGVE